MHGHELVNALTNRHTTHDAHPAGHMHNIRFRNHLFIRLTISLPRRVRGSQFNAVDLGEAHQRIKRRVHLHLSAGFLLSQNSLHTVKYTHIQRPNKPYMIVWLWNLVALHYGRSEPMNASKSVYDLNLSSGQLNVIKERHCVGANARNDESSDEWVL